MLTCPYAHAGKNCSSLAASNSSEILSISMSRAASAALASSSAAFHFDSASESRGAASASYEKIKCCTSLCIFSVMSKFMTKTRNLSFSTYTLFLLQVRIGVWIFQGT
jgi:hypothetical protein